jgi:hypothetical protein
MDLLLAETNNGGDLVKLPKDFVVIEGFENMPYMAMFGGNREASTPLQRLPQEQAFDWWGNTLFFQNDESVQMNSNTERVLLSVSLNSSGRIQIERAVRKDLEFMKPFATVTVSVSIVSTDRVVIGVNIVRLDNLERRAFVYIWDATNSELIERETKISSGGTVSAKIFGPEFDYTFE